MDRDRPASRRRADEVYTKRRAAIQTPHPMRRNPRRVSFGSCPTSQRIRNALRTSGGRFFCEGRCVERRYVDQPVLGTSSRRAISDCVNDRSLGTIDGLFLQVRACPKRVRRTARNSWTSARSPRGWPLRRGRDTQMRSSGRPRPRDRKRGKSAGSGRRRSSAGSSPTYLLDASHAQGKSDRAASRCVDGRLDGQR
jgi:hypothetical protein